MSEMLIKPIAIFDLDGTVALNEHRQHLVQNQPKDWPAFYRACVDDTPNWPVITAASALKDAGFELWLWSGRSDEVVDLTWDWLRKKAGCLHLWDNIRMRRRNDFTEDSELKRQWLESLVPPFRRRIAFVFDDRDRVVQMWRDNGLACFQVAKGDF